LLNAFAILIFEQTYMVEYKNQDEAHEDLHAHDTIVHEDDNEEVVDVIEDVSIRKK